MARSFGVDQLAVGLFTISLLVLTLAVSSFPRNVAAFTGGFTIAASPISNGPADAASPSDTITVTAFNGFSDTVTLSAFLFGFTCCSVSPSSCTLNTTVTSCVATLFAPDLAGTYDTTVTGHGVTSGLVGSVTVHIIVSDISISASPTVVGPQNPGDTGTSTITVTGLNEFTGKVSLLLGPPSSHLTASLSPSLLTFTSSGPTTQTAILSLSFDLLGTYSILVTGNATIYFHHYVLVTVLSPPTVMISPKSQFISPVGTSVVYDVNAVSLPTFAAYDIYVVTNPVLLNPVSIDLSGSVLPRGIDAQCINGVPVPGSAFDNCTAADGLGVAHDSAFSNGTYTGDGLLFAVNYNPSLLDFGISANPGTVNVAPGQSATSTITITLTSPASTAVKLTNDIIFDENGNPVAHNTISGNFGSAATMTLKASAPKGLKTNLSTHLLSFKGPRTTGSSALTATTTVPGSYDMVVSATLKYTNSSFQTVKVVHTTTVNVIVT